MNFIDPIDTILFSGVVAGEILGIAVVVVGIAAILVAALVGLWKVGVWAYEVYAKDMRRLRREYWVV